MLGVLDHVLPREFMLLRKITWLEDTWDLGEQENMFLWRKVYMTETLDCYRNSLNINPFPLPNQLELYYTWQNTFSASLHLYEAMHAAITNEKQVEVVCSCRLSHLSWCDASYLLPNPNFLLTSGVMEKLKPFFWRKFLQHKRSLRISIISRENHKFLTVAHDHKKS